MNEPGHSNDAEEEEQSLLKEKKTVNEITDDNGSFVAETLSAIRKDK